MHGACVDLGEAWDNDRNNVSCKEGQSPGKDRWIRRASSFLLLVVRMLLVVRPGAPSFFLLLVAMPGAPRSFKRPIVEQFVVF